jgi:hypothetical protein
MIFLVIILTKQQSIIGNRIFSAHNHQPPNNDRDVNQRESNVTQTLFICKFIMPKQHPTTSDKSRPAAPGNSLL